MKAAILQENLAKGLAVVGRAVGKSAGLPVLSNVLVATENGGLRLAATDLEVAIQCWVSAKVEKEGAVTLPARTLTDLVKTLPAERIDIRLTGRSQTLKLECARSKASLKGIPAQDFPQLPTDGWGDQILIEADALTKLVKQVAIAASTDSGRVMLTGVLAKLDEDRITLAAADGFRLAVRTARLSTAVSEPLSLLIPAPALIEMGRILDQEEPVRMSTHNGNQAIFRLADAQISAQLINMAFPDYEQIIPTGHATRTVVDTGELLKACKTANIFARQSKGSVRLHVQPGSDLTPGHIAIAAQADETGDNHQQVEATVDGQEIEIAFNARYLLDVLGVIDTPQVALETTTPRSPGVIRPVGDDDYLHVIMPMHQDR